MSRKTLILAGFIVVSILSAGGFLWYFSRPANLKNAKENTSGNSLKDASQKRITNKKVGNISNCNRVCDARELGGELDNCCEVIFSSESKHFAYSVKKQGKWFVILDGKEFGPYDDAWELTFSSNGEHFAYAVKKQGKSFIVLDGKEISFLNDKSFVRDTYFFLSPDGTHFAYIVRTEREGQNWALFLDEKSIGIFDDVGNIVFSPDGKHFTYTYSVKRQGKRSFIVVLDGREFGPYDDVWNPTFSSNGRHFAYVAEKQGKSFIVLDGEKLGLYDMVRSFTFSPDGTRFAYSVKKQGKWFVALDGKELGPYDDVFNLTFSPDSKHFAYIAGQYEEKRMEIFVVLDGNIISKEYELVDAYHPVIFSSDSKHFAYVAIDQEKEFTVVDGKKIGKGYDYFVFSPDGKHFTYYVYDYNKKTKEREHLLFLDGKEVDNSCNRIFSLSFDPNSEYLYYGALVGKDLWLKVKNVR